MCHLRLHHFLLLIVICGCTSAHRESSKVVPAKTEPPAEPATGVTGIGGIFFKAQDPKAMAAWYAAHLGIQSSHGFADFTWREKDHPDQIGHTTWAVFRTNTTYFSPSTAPLMIDYRVNNLAGMLAQLRRDGVKIEKVEDSDYGHFAWIMDPEGNRVELWEPKVK